MSNRTFDTLRSIESIVLPLVTFLSGLAEIWGFPYGVQIAATLALCNALMGGLLEAARKIYRARKSEQDDFGMTD
jgi:hypothetical protein